MAGKKLRSSTRKRPKGVQHGRGLRFEFLEDRRLLNADGFAIAGYKFHDLNANGVDDGEPRLENWPIFLDDDNSGTLDPGEISTLTGPDGSFGFGNLPAGD